MEFCSRRLENRAENRQLTNHLPPRDRGGVTTSSGLEDRMASLSTMHKGISHGFRLWETGQTLQWSQHSAVGPWSSIHGPKSCRGKLKGGSRSFEACLLAVAFGGSRVLQRMLPEPSKVLKKPTSQREGRKREAMEPCRYLVDISTRANGQNCQQLTSFRQF